MVVHNNSSDCVIMDGIRFRVDLAYSVNVLLSFKQVVSNGEDVDVVINADLSFRFLYLGVHSTDFV